ncbi:5',5'''-P-1,P-4-tetraphosphate phosphorylase 2 [Zopfia rhizophila CBS 207.26]|uniref:5',5'''-P-1,P-4-tetraphosphate phosphorylase 2 n=1 Tax=Zopfia rhizophila CBS 207.26 TaxID=1314779 RepID=A0A6A6ERI8_9PEZI|nr:5',5'''-P-1,P-4-tetraphosphate phosphorylase 2 [Zopfia rhizophila CBS 207.26]
MLLGLSEALPSLVEARFKTAKAAQSLIFSPTELTIIRTTTGIPFQLRYCPALAKKPVPRNDNAAPTKKPDPFDNPSPELLIADIPTAEPTHLLVLNKFPVIAEHFIIATKTNKQQTRILERDDLEATHACLKAWQNDSQQKRLFAFFNSGDHSGASQPHRHLQFLPVESMKEGTQSDGWDLLIDLISPDSDSTTNDTSSNLLQHPAIPFTHFALQFPPDPTGDQLLKAYNDLYHSAKESVDRFIASNPGNLEFHPTTDGTSPISYNLAMTTTAMAICPRRSEGCMLRRDDGTNVGFVALNGTTLGGTLMVKFQDEWDTLRAQPEKLDSILEAIGIPKDNSAS